MTFCTQQYPILHHCRKSLFFIFIFWPHGPNTYKINFIAVWKPEFQLWILLCWFVPCPLSLSLLSNPQVGGLFPSANRWSCLGEIWYYIIGSKWHQNLQIHFASGKLHWLSDLNKISNSINCIWFLFYLRRENINNEKWNDSIINFTRYYNQFWKYIFKWNILFFVNEVLLLQLLPFRGFLKNKMFHFWGTALRQKKFQT